MLGISPRRAIALFVLVAALAAPSSASAVSMYDQYEGCWQARSDNAGYGCNISVGSLATYKGWAHVSGTSCPGGIDPGFVPPPAPKSAWRWTGYSWRATGVQPDTQVYVWPYAVGWSWVWTQPTGWLAMRDGDLVINPDCGMPRP